MKILANLKGKAKNEKSQLKAKNFQIPFFYFLVFCGAQVKIVLKNRHHDGVLKLKTLNIKI